MPRNNVRGDSHFQKAVELLERCQNLKVPEAMMLAKFSTRDQACRTKCQMIYCLWNKAKSKRVKGNDAFVTPPPNSITISGKEHYLL